MPNKAAVTLDSIEELLKKQKDEIVQEISKDITTKIEALTKRIDENNNSTKSNKDEIGKLNKRVKELESKLEDQTNRSLRNTLIIRGLKEHEIENNCSQTSRKVNEVLSRVLDMPPQHISHMIKRCHRGQKKDDKVRPIFIKFQSWKDAQFVLTSITRIRTKNRHFEFKIDQMYTEDVTDRRNEAMIERRKLLNDNSNAIVKAYVASTAKLMVKEKNSQKYEVYKTF